VDKFTKAEIVDAIYEKIGMDRKDIRKVVDLFTEEVKTALIARKVIELRGFGTFEIKIRKGRQRARNPKTGETLSINPHGIAMFRAGRELKQDVWNLKLDDSSACNAGANNAAATHTGTDNTSAENDTTGSHEDKA
jgi:integration host factor subunit beta